MCSFISVFIKGTVSPYKLIRLLKIHRNRLEWLGKIYVASIHVWLWLIEAGRRGYREWLWLIEAGRRGYREARGDLDSASATESSSFI